MFLDKLEDMLVFSFMNNEINHSVDFGVIIHMVI